MGYYSNFLPLVEVNSFNSLIPNTPIFSISNGKDEKSSLPFLLPDTCSTKQILKPFNYILMMDNEFIQISQNRHPSENLFKEFLLQT